MTVSGEPDNVGSSGEEGANCAYVNHDGDWRDHLCTNTKRFVCTRPTGGVQSPDNADVKEEEEEQESDSSTEQITGHRQLTTTARSQESESEGLLAQYKFTWTIYSNRSQTVHSNKAQTIHSNKAQKTHSYRHLKTTDQR